MQKLIITLAVVAACGTALAQGSHMRSGYVRQDGTYVPPSMATNPNSTKLDNFSTQGNVNPYSGRVGTVDPYRATPSGAHTPPQSNFGSQCGYTSTGNYVCR